MNFKGLNCAQLATCQVPVEETAAVAPLRPFIRRFGINTFTNLSWLKVLQSCLSSLVTLHPRICKCRARRQVEPKEMTLDRRGHAASTSSSTEEFFRGEMYWFSSSHTLYCHISTKSQMRLQKLGMTVKTCENLAFGNTSAAPYDAKSHG